MTTVDVVVVGGGIAGVSAAYHLASDQSVILVEAETTLAFHSTGRSAAVYFENYGAAANRPLTRASRSFLVAPPPDLVDTPLATPRGAVWIGSAGQTASLRRIAAEGRATSSRISEIDRPELHERVPVLKDTVTQGIWEPDPLDLDVAAIHQTFVRGLRRRGAGIMTASPIHHLVRRRRGWVVDAGDQRISTAAVVNAAGAWGDVVAALAGVRPVGLVPKRRTAFLVAGQSDWARLPMVIDADQRFYFKPDGSQVLCSPADETPTEPGDARPDQVQVARAIEHINAATTLNIRSVRSEWAGLRTFTPDRTMVIGSDPEVDGFVWLVGQGGTGIQTAPAAGEMAAAAVRGQPLPEHLSRAGVDIGALGPGRPTLRRQLVARRPNS